jgi:hypothetical protein
MFKDSYSVKLANEEQEKERQKQKTKEMERYGYFRHFIYFQPFNDLGNRLCGYSLPFLSS